MASDSLPIKSYKFKLRRPSNALVAKFENMLALCCELYNAALQERRDAWRISHKSISYNDQQAQFPEIRVLRPDIGALPSHAAREPLKRVDRAFQAFFRRTKQKGVKAGFPRFRNIHRYDSFTFPERAGYRLDGDKLILPKFGSCRIRLHRPIEGKIKTCTIKRHADGWFVIFAVEVNQSPWLPKTGASVGVDVGLNHFAALSTGELIENPRYFRAAQAKLRVQQRSVSRKKRGSKRCQRAIQTVSRNYLKIANQRMDFCHKLSLQIIREFDDIAIEDLNITGLVKNRYVAKSISDAAWGRFRLILEGKAESAGRRVWAVPAQFTSQDCSGCGGRIKKSLAVREHRCVDCGLVLNRDVNAAINILGRAGPMGVNVAH